jgi:integrase
MRGSKRQRRPGVWELRVPQGKDSISDKYKYLSTTFHGSATEADAALRGLCDLKEAARRSYRHTISEVLDLWTQDCIRLGRSPSTIANNKSAIERTIRPRLGQTKAAKLTARDLDSFYGDLHNNGMSAKTIRNHHGMISAALSLALRWDLVAENVAKKARPPSIPHGATKSPSPDDVERIITLADQRDPRLATLIFLAALTGMRRGELCGLRWSEVNFAERSLLCHGRSSR